jgi:hypothetical protein
MASPALDQAIAQMVLKGLFGVANFVNVTTPTNVKLTITVPTATVPGTELPNGGGYTTGGQAVTFGNLTAISTGYQIFNTGAFSWTNSGSAAWVLCGTEAWYSTTRIAFSVIDGQPMTIGVGSPASWAANALCYQFP